MGVQLSPLGRWVCAECAVGVSRSRHQSRAVRPRWGCSALPPALVGFLDSTGRRWGDPFWPATVTFLPLIGLVYKVVKMLTADPLDGIKVFPNPEDHTDLHVTIWGPEGTLHACWRLVPAWYSCWGRTSLPLPAKGYFLTKIFHPHVGANGESCVNVLKRDWTAELGIQHVLLSIKCLLIHPNP